MDNYQANKEIISSKNKNAFELAKKHKNKDKLQELLSACN